MKNKEIELIKERNRKVEADKAWEKSTTRKFLIAVMTYGIIVIFLFVINNENPWFNAVIPTMGFVLSTISLPIFKKYWLKNIYKNDK